MSNNNDNSGTMAVAFVFAMLAMAAMFIYALAAFVAGLFTILAFCAWFRPITLFGETTYPHEARAFVRNGVIGACLTPLFAAFAAALLELDIGEQTWPHIIIVGYILGSLGVEIVKAEEEEKAKAMRNVSPDVQQLPPPKVEDKPALPPFRFAEWDDEE